MDNSDQKYKLLDVAEKIGVSKAWINKVQGKTGIPRPTGKKGQKTEFTEDDLERLKNVNLLRLLGFEFDDINRLNQLENKACSFLHEDEFLEYARPEQGVYPLLVHAPEKCQGKRELSIPGGEGRDNEYNDTLREISKFHEAIKRKAESLGGELINLRCKCHS